MPEFMPCQLKANEPGYAKVPKTNTGDDMTDNKNALIMVVDDNLKNLQVLGSLLKENQFRVAVAQDGNTVLEYMKTRLPDLVLLDVMMPGMNGYEVCRKIKADPNTCDVPVLFITALTDVENRLQGFEAGGEDYITKPFIQEEVLARVRVFAERQRARQEMKAVNERLANWNKSLEDAVQKRTRELEAMQSRVVMQEKMASIGQLAAGIAHELNNPINFIYTNFVTLEENVKGIKSIIEDYHHLRKNIQGDEELGEDLHKLLSNIGEREERIHLDFILKDLGVLFNETREGFKRTSWIINSMRDFSRADQKGDFSLFDLNKGIEDTLVIARNEYKYQCEVLKELSDLPQVNCMAQQINQVLLNLIVNSAQAIKSQNREEKGTIRIKTYAREDYICCDIGDDGPGIPLALHSRIFDPFFTTKEVGQGTGLGLSIAWDIVVNRHKGELSLEEGVPGNTLFRICLPNHAEITRITEQP
jgi:signal transduction histidine kinase